MLLLSFEQKKVSIQATYRDLIWHNNILIIHEVYIAIFSKWEHKLQVS
jgi:hypothetical protein